MFSDIANTIATCISALAACLATYLAARAIRDNSETKRSEFESARPYFTFSNFGLRRPVVAKALSSDTELLDPRAARIEGLIVNDGRRHASNVCGALLILPIKEKAETGVFPISIADDVAPKSEWHVGTAILSVLPADFSGIESSPDFHDPGFFVLVAVQYTDTLASRHHTQCSFMRWPGISNGVISGQLCSASREEKGLVLDRYSDFVRPYLDGRMPVPQHAA